MSEYRYVEQPILNWLCGEDKATYRVGGLGWTYRDEAAMAQFERPLEDPLVEKLLVEAILSINPHVTNETQARPAVDALRKAMSHSDRLTANRATLDLLRDGATVVLQPGQDAQTVQFIAFDPGPSGTERLYRDQPIPSTRGQAVSRRYSASRQWHPTRRGGVQELRDEPEGLAGGGAPAPPLSERSTADADTQRVLRGSRRGRIPLWHRAVSRRQQGTH